MKLLKRGLFTSASAIALMAGLLLTGPSVAWAKKHPAPSAVDPTSVTACGTYAGTNTIYVLQNNITTGSTGACITFGGSDNTLDFNGFTVTGPGSGTSSTGLLVESSANEDVVEGSGGSVTAFGTGILDQGSNTAGDALNPEANGIGLELNGSGFTGGTEIWSNFGAENNATIGVYVYKCSDECSVTDFDSSGNGTDGVLITGSEGPRMNEFTAFSNGSNGVHIGCSASSSACGTNSEVKLGDAPQGDTGGSPAISGNKLNGVLVDATEKTVIDQLYLLKAKTNGNGTTSVDLNDASTTCGSNHWVHNNYVTALAGGVVPNPSTGCIPLSAF